MLTTSHTALSVAAMRVRESELPVSERLFEDPYAAVFHPAAKRSWGCPSTCQAGGRGDVVVSKFEDACPLYRLSGIYERYGVELSPTTLGD